MAILAVLVLLVVVGIDASHSQSCPDAFVQWLANFLLPRVMKMAASLIPVEIGYFLRAYDNHITIGGRFDISGDMSYNVWHSDLAVNFLHCLPNHPD